MNSTVSPLNTLIETIIEKGNITQEEQRTINMLATKLSIDQAESFSVNKLIGLISEGKIEVTN
jgi:hypothetical protein